MDYLHQAQVLKVANRLQVRQVNQVNQAHLRLDTVLLQVILALRVLLSHLIALVRLRVRLVLNRIRQPVQKVLQANRLAVIRVLLILQVVIHLRLQVLNLLRQVNQVQVLKAIVLQVVHMAIVQVVLKDSTYVLKDWQLLHLMDLMLMQVYSMATITTRA